MPAKIVSVEQQEQQQQQQNRDQQLKQQQQQQPQQVVELQREEGESRQPKQKCFDTNLCRCGADATATRSTSAAAAVYVAVDVAAASTITTTTTTTATTTLNNTRRRHRYSSSSSSSSSSSNTTLQFSSPPPPHPHSTSRTTKSTSACWTLVQRVAIIITALVFSTSQQQQQQQQQPQGELHRLWPFSNGVGAAAATTSTFFNNNNFSSEMMQTESFNDVEGVAVATQREAEMPTTTTRTTLMEMEMRMQKQHPKEKLPQPRPRTEATNHTFKSLAFHDGFAVAPRPSEAGESLPIFDFGMPRNITGRTGHTEAIIKCRVDSLHDKSVSWIRKRDLHILTVGTATYTSDKRFQVTESKDARDWTLHVKAPVARDSGIYECQVNTEPKMSMAFQLNIIEISPDAKAVISGPHDLHFKAGSAIILNCVVQQPSIKDIGPIYWYRGEHMITPFDADENDDNGGNGDGDGDRDRDVDKEGGREKVKTKPKPATEAADKEMALNEVLQKDFATRIAMESQLGDTLKSRLRIANAQTTDTGNYTCQPTTASSASVLVHVINDENPAAMQKSAAFALFNGVSQQLYVLLVLIPTLTQMVVCLLLHQQQQHQHQLHQRPQQQQQQQQ